MAFLPLLAKAGSTVVTGLAGAVAYDAARAVVKRAPLREGAVVAATWSLRGTRKAEEVAENVRLNAADVFAEAKERIGEEATPPGTGVTHDHEH
ncbi:DUF1490 family protein [Gordonia humi]|uniref:DUF1490 family protein n=1 Tax=Gordonia humi TaxID=686429 RepID=A0A840F196_9ACTN|nr:DUF1490 family protein [Gordonia humi]MBB4136384.1 hypothetical protein [Gordonia humi]